MRLSPLLFNNEIKNRPAVLVTGGAGYIGAHACKALQRAGFLPIAYDDLSTGHAYAVKWGPFVQASLSNQTALRETIALYRPVAVIHFAASALVVESISHPGKYYENNVGSTLALLEAMKEGGVWPLIFSSTCALYGNPQSTPIEETHPLGPINPYGRSKWMAEQIMRDFDQAHGIKTVALRYFNAAGADLDLEAGENHRPETHLIPNVIRAALGLTSEIVVYGADFPTNDGSAVRDYIHVQDLAEAHVLALQWLLAEKQSIAINLGTGVGSSVFQIIQAVEALSSTSIPLRIEPRRLGEPAQLIADHRLASSLLGWKPKLSDVPTLIRSAWKWHEWLKEQELGSQKILK